MKKIIGLLLFVLLGTNMFAQNDRFSSYETMVGRTVYFHAGEMARFTHFSVSVMEGGKLKKIAPSNSSDMAKALSSAIIGYRPQDKYFDYSILDGYLCVDGVELIKKTEYLKVSKDDSVYYFEINSANNYCQYMRNPEVWSTYISELNREKRYYLDDDHLYELNWYLGAIPESSTDDIRFKAKGAIANWADLGVSKSWIESKKDCFLNKAQKIERENAMQRKLESTDALSKLGLVLVGRFGKRSVRLLEIRDSLSLFIGLTDDTNGNINLCYLRIEAKDYASFEQKMSIVNEKFINWSKTAQEEHVTNFKKMIPVDFADEVGYFTMGFSNNWVETKLYAVFEVDEKGKAYLRLDNWEEYDSRNSSYESQMHNPYLMFYSAEDFTHLYELIKFDNAYANYKRVKQIADAENQAIRDRDSKFD